MTVLEAEEDSDERSVPPRKKFCLSLSRRDHNISKNITQPPHSSSRGGFFEDQDLPYNTSKMLNGYRSQLGTHQDSSYDILGGSSDGLRIATLCNLGNTCFLNSVIYTLRFAPSFLHNLHHLATDLSNLNDKQLQTKFKSSSLGRTGVSLTSSGNRSWSSKDLSALSGISELNKSRIQVATEKLHELFVALRLSETRDSCEPYQPDAFLQALRDVNPIFEGNQQQDAHELLVCLLDNIRETFQLLVRYRESQFGQSNGDMMDFTMDRLMDVQFEGNGSGKRSIRKKKQKKYQPTRGSTTCLSQTNMNGITLPPRSFENGHMDFIGGNGELISHRPESKKCFISEDFEGVSLLRTTCLECEHVTERKETFCDICVPIETGKSNEKDENGKLIDGSEVYRHSVVTSELLCGRDKYWCSSCLRYNEARRAVSFPALPRLLVLQLKRFSTAAGSMEKVNNYMPTPLTLQCFCEECSNDQQSSTSNRTSESRHVYKLYSVIMHQGATSTAGHYIAYTKVPEDSMFTEYFRCDRDARRHNVSQSSSSSNSTNSASSSILKCFRSKSNISENKEHLIKMGCRSMECCGIRRVKNIGNTWLECDDELVRAIRERELLDKLAPNPRNSATPYLLFYVRSTT
ncbi:ubiquitin carboxyl-terminal hydrolase 1-like isoform X1 [Chelonus insularis]|uniref:ubiquitin carboxyl-terminal hydrolase 1-like isoform X1 n=1 Tax=Chelonus insularis TaxID=460826 RepID=UPI00158F5F72|nr:ubiquitin carboxyl-terminal hydrolase 1-like isoform X1 [Chelonus insularis]